jgi:phage shock protein C
MGGLDLNKKLWRMPQRGMVKGVCAGIAQYLDVPVKLVRLITVLAMIFGLFFFVVVAYIILTFALDPMPESECTARMPTSGELLAAGSRTGGQRTPPARNGTLCHVGYLYVTQPFSPALTER